MTFRYHRRGGLRWLTIGPLTISWSWTRKLPSTFVHIPAVAPRDH